MISIAIVEDQKDYSDLLTANIKRYGEESGTEFRIDVFSDGMSFLDEYSQRYQIVLMDIAMPHMNGLEVAHRLREMDKLVCLIFLTNLAQYAIKGYEVSAMDFLVKPISYDLLKLKLEKAIEHIKVEKFYYITIPNGVKKVQTSDIYWIESRKHYLYFHTVDGEIRMRGSLRDIIKYFEENDFAVLSNSLLVNLAKVEESHRDEVTVAGQNLPISKAHRTIFWEKLTTYLSGGI